MFVKYLNVAVKILTAVTAVMCLAVAVFGLVNGMHPLLAVATLALGGLFGFMTYSDIKAML